MYIIIIWHSSVSSQNITDYWNELYEVVYFIYSLEACLNSLRYQ